MEQNKATINGLIDGISIAENRVENKTSYNFNIEGDLLYNERGAFESTIPSGSEYFLLFCENETENYSDYEYIK